MRLGFRYCREMTECALLHSAYHKEPVHCTAAGISGPVHRSCDSTRQIPLSKPLYNLSCLSSDVNIQLSVYCELFVIILPLGLDGGYYFVFAILGSQEECLFFFATLLANVFLLNDTYLYLVHLSVPLKRQI